MLNFNINIPWNVVMIVVWIAVIAIGIIVEAQTSELVSIWFAISGAVAIVCAIAGLSIPIQVAVFSTLTLLLVICTRPLVKKLTKNTVTRYIESKAKMIGVTAKEITSKLNGNYTVDAVDSICEELQSYKLTISKLPFNVDKNQKFKAKVPESKNDILNSHNILNIDDEVDDSLIRLADLNK